MLSDLQFGSSVASLGDLDGDGVGDLAVGAFHGRRRRALADRGAVWVLFLNTDGTVKSHQKISDTPRANFTGILDNGDWFGVSVANRWVIWTATAWTDLAVGAEPG